MRSALAKYHKRRRQFTAVFVRYGMRSAYKGPAKVTLLFHVVTTGGEVVADHVWFTICQAWQQLKLVPGIGETVTFQATIESYRKGYRGRRGEDDDDLPPVRSDYKLARPGRIARVDAEAPAQPLLL